MRTATDEAKKPATRGARGGPDAIALLKADHAAVKELFKEYNQLCEGDGEETDKGEVATRICQELTVHATIEEEIFYPALREALDDQDLLDEAEVEHASAKDLIAQLEQMEPGDNLYDAKVIVLGEYIDHHVKEEEGEMFPKAKKSGVDLTALGAEMATRQQELKSELGLAEDDEADEDDEEADDDEDEEDDADTEDETDDAGGNAKSSKKNGSRSNGNRRAA